MFAEAQGARATNLEVVRIYSYKKWLPGEFLSQETFGSKESVLLNVVMVI